MSVQFGRWNFDGRPADREYLAKAEGMLAPYSPDGGAAYIKDSVGILFRAFHTTKESRSEAQPHTTPSGTVLTWDGRLDNRPDLIGKLTDVLTAHATDIEIVAAVYEQWGTDCFARLLGDWALTIWNPSCHSLLLAKDVVGTRHLYYSTGKGQVTWSTILDPLVLLAEKTFSLEEEYIAGWLSFFPATHLTPYVGIHSVPASCFVRLTPTTESVVKYWDFDPGKRIRYRADDEYEEHFRAVFAESVGRRLRSDCPILAELSGGMDSSSIVCMADTVIARRAAETPRVHTISYYNDSEPNWNERPYFTKVEEQRGRAGCHIDVGSRETLNFELVGGCFRPTPGSGGPANEASRQFSACMISQGSRVVLSGIGGDEMTGGVPTPTPELEDLLARAHFESLARELRVWALLKRMPWFYLFTEAARGFFPPSLVGVPAHKRPGLWLNPKFVKRNRAALRGYEQRLKLFGPLPSFQTNLSTLDALRRQLGCAALPSEPPYEKSYPYLDRGFLEFLFAIPAEQLVRPGQRRSLMRRALARTVPDEVLNRKRKAFVSRAPATAISREWNGLMEMTRCMASNSLGIVDEKYFSEALHKARRGENVMVVPLLRAIGTELWLRNLRASGIVDLDTTLETDSQSTAKIPDNLVRKNFLQLRTNLKRKGGDLI